MNRYRTTPGLGPSQATATTTCQKCLQKGHYSYECKGGLQSRPYVSRASRSEQLRNPKLKPALKETKLDEAVISSSEKPLAVQTPVETKDEQARGRSTTSPEPSAKRMRRSTSTSSSSSVATISTADSRSDEVAPSRSRHVGRRLEDTTSTAPVRRRRHLSRERSSSPARIDKRPSGRHGARPRRRESEEAPDDDQDRQKSHHDRRSRSPQRERHSSAPPRNVKVDKERPVPNRPYRQRSPSPYSRRIALTQAMNAGQ